MDLRYEFEPTGEPDFKVGKGTPGHAQLYINGELAGQTELPVTIPLLVSIGEGLICGRDAGSAVSSRYQPPFAFSGALKQVTIDVSGELIQDDEAKMRAVLARQ